jgi:hypothetical protein
LAFFLSAVNQNTYRIFWLTASAPILGIPHLREQT